MAFSIPAGFKNLGHYIAAGAKSFVNFVKSDLDPALVKIQADAPTIEAVTRIVSPQAAQIEDAAFHVLGAFGQAADGLSDATVANGVNVQLDSDGLALVKAAIAAVKQLPAEAKAAAAPSGPLAPPAPTSK